MSQQPANILELMKQLLAHMGITDYEPAVPHMLVELFYRHVTDVLQEARSASQRKGKGSDIDEDDLKFAIQMVLDKSRQSSPSIQMMQKSAEKDYGGQTCAIIHSKA